VVSTPACQSKAGNGELAEAKLYACAIEHVHEQLVFKSTLYRSVFSLLQPAIYQYSLTLGGKEYYDRGRRPVSPETVAGGASRKIKTN
jgi:hypothetical protein